MAMDPGERAQRLRERLEQQRAGRAERRPRSPTGQIVRLSLLLVGMLAAYRYLTRIAESEFTVPVSSGPAAPADAAVEGEQEILPLSESDERQLTQQRELVAALAHRHIGASLTGRELGDLDSIQRLLEAAGLEGDRRLELQALGVALGDVMASQLGLSWVAVQDEFGRSRALRYRDSDTLFFPIAMISRRVEAGLPVDVKELYRRTRDAVQSFRSPRRAEPLPPAA
jgi:hypothetical protein